MPGESEADLLSEHVEFCRIVFRASWDGLTVAQCCARPIASSVMSLAGLADHLATVERTVVSHARTGRIGGCTVVVDRALRLFDLSDGADPMRDWQEACTATGREIDGARSSGRFPRWAELALLELLAEYSSHLVQAQLLRTELDPGSARRRAGRRDLWP